MRSLSLRLLELKSFRFGARYTEIYLWVGSLSHRLSSLSFLSPLLSVVSSLFSCSLLFLPFSLIPPLFFPSFSPFSLLSSLLSSVFSFFLLSSYLLLSSLIFLLSPFSIFFSFLILFLSSSLLLFFSSLSPSPLCSLLSSYSYF